MYRSELIVIPNRYNNRLIPLLSTQLVHLQPSKLSKLSRCMQMKEWRQHKWSKQKPRRNFHQGEILGRSIRGLATLFKADHKCIWRKYHIIWNLTHFFISIHLWIRNWLRKLTQIWLWEQKVHVIFSQIKDHGTNLPGGSHTGKKGTI